MTFTPSFKPYPKQHTPPKPKQGVSKTPTSSRGKLEKRLDTVFSLWRRKKDMVGNKVQCFTCPAKLPIGEMHCGHFIHRAVMATRWLLENTAPQCWNCNILKEGNLEIFRANLIKKYGEKEVERLESLRRVVTKYSPDQIEEMIKQYSK